MGETEEAGRQVIKCGHEVKKPSREGYFAPGDVPLFLSENHVSISRCMAVSATTPAGLYRYYC